MKTPDLFIRAVPWAAALAGCLAAGSVSLGGEPVKIDYFPIPVQHYAILDLSAASTNGLPVELIALDDANEVAFGYETNPDDQPNSVLNVEKWSSGTLTDGVRVPFQTTLTLPFFDGDYPLTVTLTVSLGYDYFFSVGYERLLLAGGTVFGNEQGSGVFGWEDVPVPYYIWSAAPAANTLPFGAVADAGDYQVLPTKEFDGYSFPTLPGGSSITAVSPSGNVTAGGFAGTCQTTKPPGGRHLQDDGVSWIGNVVWDGGPYGIVADDGSTTPCQVDDPNVITSPMNYYVYAVNDQGWALTWLAPYQSPPYNLWDPGHRQFLALDGQGLAINNDADVPVRGTPDDAKQIYDNNAYLIEKGAAGTKEYFLAQSATGAGLIPKRYQSEVRAVYPLLLSNEVAGVDAGTQPAVPLFSVVLQAQVRRSAAADDWEEATLLLRRFSDGTTDLHEITGFDSSFFYSINTSGVIAMLGDPEGDTGPPAAQDALLLVPLDIVEESNDIDASQANRAESSSPTMTDKDGKVVTSLKVAKMSEDGVITGTGSSASLTLDKDSDRFYVRLLGAANLGITSIKVDTIKNPDPDLYNDGPVELTLSKDGNDLVTKSLLLTSDDVDDGQPVDGIADNQKDDRTFKVELGGKFHIKSVTTMSTDKPPVAIDNLADSEVPVPVKKTVHFTPIILRSYPNKDPLTTVEYAEYQLRAARERYAQVGINLVWAPVTIKDPPAGANLNLGFNITTGGSSTGDQAYVSPQAKLVINQYGTPNDSLDIHVFWINTVNNTFDGEVGTLGGFAIAPYYFTEGDSQYFNNCFIASNQGPFVVAHELGHLLTNDGHESDPHNVMWGKDQSPTNELSAHKRFNDTQERIMLLTQPPIGDH